MLRRSDVFLSVALALAVGAPASAAPITVSFTGTVSTVTDDAGLLDGSIGVGTPYAGSFSYDPALLPDSEPDPNSGTYWIDPASFSLSLAIGSYSISYDPLASSGAATVQNDAAIVLQDQYALNVDDVVGLESLPALLVSTYVQVLLTDSTQTTLGSDSLVALPYTDAAWDGRILQLGAEVELEPGVFADVFLEGTLSILPEPASALLLAPLALLVLRRVGRSAPIS